MLKLDWRASTNQLYCDLSLPKVPDVHALSVSWFVTTVEPTDVRRPFVIFIKFGKQNENFLTMTT